MLPTPRDHPGATFERRRTYPWQQPPQAGMRTSLRTYTAAVTVCLAFWALVLIAARSFALS